MRRQIVALSFATLVTSLIISRFSISRSRHCSHVPIHTYLPLHRSCPPWVLSSVQPPVLSLYSLGVFLHWLRLFQNSKIPFGPCDALKRPPLPYSEPCHQPVRKSLIPLCAVSSYRAIARQSRSTAIPRSISGPAHARKVPLLKPFIQTWTEI